jgi:hypothetical protein
LIPIFCGNNRYPESGVRSTCLASVKKDASWKEESNPRILLLNLSDNTQEALPFLAKTLVGDTENWLVYANRGMDKAGVLLTQKLSLTTSGGVPTGLKGRSSFGWYFFVPKLDPFNIRSFLPLLITKGD